MWVGHVTRMGEMRNREFYFETLKGRDHLVDPDIDVRVILN